MSAIRQPAASPQFLTVPEVAELLRISPRTVYAWVAEDKIPFRKPSRNRLLFDRDAILDWVAGQGPQAGGENSFNVTPLRR
jgi:excisionase family DNA binding protein